MYSKHYPPNQKASRSEMQLNNCQNLNCDFLPKVKKEHSSAAPCYCCGLIADIL